MLHAETFAHPYVSAVFDVANEDGDVDQWMANLQNLATIAANEDFVELADNPRITREELLGFLSQYLVHANDKISSFIDLLYKNNKLTLLPVIFELFAKKVEACNNQIHATIQSAFAMNDTEKSNFEKLLTKKVGKQVIAQVEVNPELIGGVKVLLQDKVLDASVQGGLNKLQAQLT